MNLLKPFYAIPADLREWTKWITSQKPQLPDYTVAKLPPAADNAYTLATVTDATQTMITGLGLVPSGGGSNVVPVFCNGTDWRII